MNMQSLRKLYRSIPFMLALVAMFTLFACADRTPTGPEDLSKKGPSNNSKAREIVQGFFFGSGTAAQAIPEIRDSYAIDNLGLDAKEINEALAMHEQWLDEMEANDPGFFDSLEPDLRSGDQVRVQDALERAATAVASAASRSRSGQATLDYADDPQNFQDLREAINAHPGLEEVTDEDLQNALATARDLGDAGDTSDDSVQACSLFLVCVLYIALAVHNTVALTFAVAVAAVAAVAVALAIEIEVTTGEIQQIGMTSLQYGMSVDSITQSYAK